ncbi:hypothetical protein Nepgr_011430 [Nepenthes gracilis]|uniref:Uncharacterized protein n=1 Tax=Nepenthes gracilis TaxID=150966 RepID=A0AAD3SFB7_NEPGR|nr:hypothetical protein Nepgr_011430 [Nepenthes gracilis]
MMNSLGSRIIAAITITGCSLLFISYLRRKFPTSGGKCLRGPTRGPSSANVQGDHDDGSSSRSGCSSQVKVRKRVRFSIEASQRTSVRDRDKIIKWKSASRRKQEVLPQNQR